MTITDGINEWKLDLTSFRVAEIGVGKVEISGTYDGPYAPMGDVLAGKGHYSNWKSTILPDRHGVDIEVDGLWYYKFWYTGVNTDPGSFTISGYCDYAHHWQGIPGERPPVRS